MHRLLTTTLVLALAAAPLQAQESKAAKYLAAQFIKQFCDGKGRFTPGGLVETDLTGDGHKDLLLYSGGLSCANGMPACGAVYCDVDLYVRKGDLLEKAAGLNSQCAEVIPGHPPAIRLCHKDSGPWTVRWNGKTFDP